MPERTDAGRTGRMQDRLDAGQNGCRKGLMQAGQVGCRTEWMQERMDAGHNGYRPLQIHRTTKRMHERRMFFAELLTNRTINDASIFKTHSPYCTFAIHAKSLG